MDKKPQLQDGNGDRSVQARLRIFGQSVWSHLSQMEPGRRRWLSAAFACGVVCVAAIAWYAARTDWRTLYAGLDPQDAREMASELTAAGISFDVSPDGTSLRVPAQVLDKARLATTAKGGPKSGRMGFELFDKPNWIGSEFDEKVNYQRALEGELEHTINSLSSVQFAHVHLVMPHDSLFTEQQRDAKASVVLKLRHRSLGEDEVESIRNLVASAVDDLHPENVVLVDADGRAQLGRKSGSAQAEEHEQALAAKLLETLEPVAGPGNVRASVNVEYDTSTADEIDEAYDPNATVTLSMQREDQTAGAQPVAAGIPGAASNAPNVQPPLYPSQSSSAQSRKQESATYAASKRTRHTQQAAGKIRRITAAVLINDRKVGSGKQLTWQSRTPDELKHLNDLAQAAIGYDASRGDQDSVENLQFEQEPAEAVGFADRIMKGAAQSGLLIKYGTILLCMAVLMLFVVRPLMRKASVSMGAPALPAAANPAGTLPAGDEQAALALQESATEKQKQQAQAVFEQVADHIRREPAQTSRLLQSWINAD